MDTLFKWVQYFLHRMKVLNDKGVWQTFNFFLKFQDVRLSLFWVQGHREEMLKFLCLRFQEGIEHCGTFLKRLMLVLSSHAYLDLNDNF